MGAHLDRGRIGSEITTSEQIDEHGESDVNRFQRVLLSLLVRLTPFMRHSTDDTRSLVVQGSRVIPDLSCPTLVA